MNRYSPFFVRVKVMRPCRIVISRQVIFLGPTSDGERVSHLIEVGGLSPLVVAGVPASETGDLTFEAGGLF